MSNHLTGHPAVVERPEQPCLVVRRTVTMSTIAEVADEIPRLLDWATERGLTPAGPVFFRYVVIDMAREMVVDAGIPLDTPVPGEGDVRADVLPSGRYATVLHVGHPDTLVGATADLHAWADAEGLAWDVHEEADGEHWGCRLEWYLSDPDEEPDMTRWRTELAFRLAD